MPQAQVRQRILGGSLMFSVLIDFTLDACVHCGYCLASEHLGRKAIWIVQ